MTKIFIVKFSEDSINYGDGDDRSDTDILKAFKSLDVAINYVNYCYNDCIKKLKEANADIEYQKIDDDGACIYWDKTEIKMSGITDYTILERELAD